MKKINEHQLEVIMRLAEKYNVGIKEFTYLKNMLSSLEDVVEVTQVDVIPSEVTDH
jgi:hypothetical protein